MTTIYVATTDSPEGQVFDWYFSEIYAETVVEGWRTKEVPVQYLGALEVPVEVPEDGKPGFGSACTLIESYLEANPHLWERPPAQ